MIFLKEELEAALLLRFQDDEDEIVGPVITEEDREEDAETEL